MEDVAEALYSVVLSLLKKIITNKKRKNVV
jgi:hypothetical protein